jgi:hypothetical protein
MGLIHLIYKNKIKLINIDQPELVVGKHIYYGPSYTCT